MGLEQWTIAALSLLVVIQLAINVDVWRRLSIWQNRAKYYQQLYLKVTEVRHD